MADYLSAVQAAELIGCSDTFVRNQIRAGALPARKVRGTWRIRRGDAVDFDFDFDLDEQDEQNESSERDAQNEPSESNESRLRAESPPIEPSSAIVSANAEQNEANGSKRTNAPDTSDHRSDLYDQQWRADLLAQNGRLTEDKEHLRDELAQRDTVHAERVGALEQTLVVREARVSDLTDQVSVLEAKVREILEKGQDEAMGLANRIADLVERQQDAESRIYELQPVAERVPMLEAAVDETKTRLHETEGDLVERDKKLFERERQLADISEDIETIASRPVAGPVFRLLTKGKLRI